MRLKLYGGRIVVHTLLIPMLGMMVLSAGVVFVSAFAVALLLHEAAHIGAANAFRIKVYKLECTPFGCTAKTEGFGFVNHGAEAIMAAAGPAANIILAGAVLLLQQQNVKSDFLFQFMQANIGLAAVNLLPVYPMDGGRILQSVLAVRYTQKACNVITGILGVVVGIIIFGFGVYQAVVGAFNVSVFLVSCFMVYCSICQCIQRTEGSAEFWLHRKQLFLKRGIADAHIIAAHKNTRAGAVLPVLHHKKYNVIYIIDDDLEVVDKLGEGTLQKRMLEKGSYKKLLEL